MAPTRKNPGADEARGEAPRRSAASEKRFARSSTAGASVTTAAPVTAPGEPPNGTPPPTFTIGGPASSSWREQALTRVAELRTLARWMRAQTSDAGADELVASIEAHLDAAQEAAEGTAKIEPRLKLRAVDHGRARGAHGQQLRGRRGRPAPTRPALVPARADAELRRRRAPAPDGRRPAPREARGARAHVADPGSAGARPRLDRHGGARRDFGRPARGHARAQLPQRPLRRRRTCSPSSRP